MSSHEKSIKELLALYFNVIGEKETEIDNQRFEIQSIDGFNAVSLFSLIDKESKNFISLKDLQFFLGKASYKDESLRMFIHCFDKNNDFALDYVEFCNLIGFNPENSSEGEVEVPEAVVNSFTRLILNEIDLVDVCGGIASEIKSRIDFTTYEAFLEIDSQGKKYIDAESLSSFLEAYNFETTNVEKIIWRLDTDGDDRISYEEFCIIFSPH